MRLVLATVAGGALAASLPPRGWWPVGLFGFLVLGGALQDAPPRARASVGLVAGLALMVPGLWWAADLHAVGAAVLMVVEASMFAVVGLLVSPKRPWLSLPAAVVIIEAVRWRWPFGGLPFASPVLGQVDAPWLPIARWGGSLGVLLVSVLLAGMLGAVRTATPPSRTWVLFGALLAVAGVLWLVPSSGPSRPTDTIDVALVQGGGARGQPAVATDRTAPLRRALARTADVPGGTDLVIWPEDVIDVTVPFDASDASRQLGDVARNLEATLIVGVTEQTPGVDGVPAFRNAAVVIQPDGQVGDRYEKVLRVPFGEYVPYRNLLDRVADLSRVPRDAVAGAGPAVVRTPMGAVGTVISFEAMFPQRARAAIQQGGRILVVPTNAASYRGAAVPSQQVAGARLRAVETGRTVLQAAPTGYSAIIDSTGQVRVRSALGAGEVIAGRVTLRDDTTPFVRFGDTPVLIVAGVMLFVAWWRVPVRGFTPAADSSQ